jgi:hypothetical protein
MYELVLDGQSTSVPLVALITKCHLFQSNRFLLAQPSYQVQSRVSASSLRVFVSAIGGTRIDISSEAIGDLSLLCHEFGFREFSTQIAAWQSSHGSADVNELRRAVASLERRIDAMQEAYLCEIQALCAAIGGASGPPPQQQEQPDVDRLREENGRLAKSNEALVAQISALQQENKRITESVQHLRQIVASLTDSSYVFDAPILEPRQDTAPRPEKSDRPPPARQQPPATAEQAAQPRQEQPRTEFEPAKKTEKCASVRGGEVDLEGPDGIVAYLSRECGGNVHDHNVVCVTSSEPKRDEPQWAAKNAADVTSDTFFCSAYRSPSDDIPHAANNWICYEFKTHTIRPTHYAIRTYAYTPGAAHLKNWVVESSADGQNWVEIDRKEGSTELNGKNRLGIWEVVRNEPCRFIRLTNVGRNHFGDDSLAVSAFEIFGSFVESRETDRLGLACS